MFLFLIPPHPSAKVTEVTPSLVQDKVTTCIGECASVNRYCVSYTLCCVPADPGISGFFFSFTLQFVHEKEIVAEDDQVFLMKQQVMFCS